MKATKPKPESCEAGSNEVSEVELPSLDEIVNDLVENFHDCEGEASSYSILEKES